jgi:HTH-type transcriptional regulator/antitoxin HigA
VKPYINQWKQSPLDQPGIEHPGVMLRAVLHERGINQASLARATNLTPKHVNQILMGKARISPETALLLEEALGTPSAEAWCDLQCAHELYLLRNNTEYPDEAE